MFGKSVKSPVISSLPAEKYAMEYFKSFETSIVTLQICMRRYSKLMLPKVK